MIQKLPKLMNQFIFMIVSIGLLIGLIKIENDPNTILYHAVAFMIWVLFTEKVSQYWTK